MKAELSKRGPLPISNNRVFYSSALIETRNNVRRYLRRNVTGLRHDRCTLSRTMRARALRAPLLVLASKDKAFQRQVRAYLSERGLSTHDLTLVRGESEWRKALSNERLRLVLLDDGVSPGNGLEWLTTLRRRFSEVLIIYVAEHHSLELEKAVRQLGVLYYTGKPLEQDSLEKVLTTVIPSSSPTKDGSLHL